ncbi:hypothetical protein [Clostridium oryzae]|uniref:Uncharacterized protein n=1 Tax=Clostridium oryzae TaxID=1450648 RepID=A0A1V4I3P5_9CLOT|nr:hypothetical protein [Clostridium oryzae]OPJ54611.1 hypothetical protein CLORY_45410 [Clostridium oryzae]
MKRERKTDNVEKKDKLMSGPPNTGSYGISTSSNITIGSAGAEGDGSHSLFPDFHKSESWIAKTNPPIDETDAEKTKNK